MGWFDAGSRLALALRRLRGRFGIAAPRVAVRTHIPWYWRAAAVTVMAAIGIALALWIYDAGRRFAGFDSDETTQELQLVRSRASELQSELSRMQKLAASADSSLQIERATQQQLAQQVRLLETENARLKEDLAEFEQLSSADAPMGMLTITRLRVEPSGSPGRYKYTLLATMRQPQKSHEFNGVLKLLVTLQRGGQDVIMELPTGADAGSSQYQIVVRYFRKIEGEFAIPPGTAIRMIEARILQAGVVKASRQVLL